MFNYDINIYFSRNLTCYSIDDGKEKTNLFVTLCVQNLQSKLNLNDYLMIMVKAYDQMLNVFCSDNPQNICIITLHLVKSRDARDRHCARDVSALGSPQTSQIAILNLSLTVKYYLWFRD